MPKSDERTESERRAMRIELVHEIKLADNTRNIIAWKSNWRGDVDDVRTCPRKLKNLVKSLYHFYRSLRGCPCDYCQYQKLTHSYRVGRWPKYPRSAGLPPVAKECQFGNN